MIAKVFVYDDETDESVLVDFSFDENFISSWYVNVEGEINIVIDGVMFTLEPNPDLMNYLNDCFDF